MVTPAAGAESGEAERRPRKTVLNKDLCHRDAGDPGVPVAVN